jgi:hypothetical protein
MEKKREIKFRAFDRTIDTSIPFEMPEPIPYLLGAMRISQDEEGYDIEQERDGRWVKITADVFFESIKKLLSNIKEE